MAKTGETFILTDEQKRMALDYIRASGYFKFRLAQFLKISRPTLNKILVEDTDFFTEVEAANAEFCKELIEKVKEKNPLFLPVQLTAWYAQREYLLLWRALAQ